MPEFFYHVTNHKGKRLCFRFDSKPSDLVKNAVNAVGAHYCKGPQKGDKMCWYLDVHKINELEQALEMCSETEAKQLHGELKCFLGNNAAPVIERQVWKPQTPPDALMMAIECLKACDHFRALCPNAQTRMIEGLRNSSLEWVGMQSIGDSNSEEFHFKFDTCDSDSHFVISRSYAGSSLDPGRGRRSQDTDIHNEQQTCRVDYKIGSTDEILSTPEVIYATASSRDTPSPKRQKVSHVDSHTYTVPLDDETQELLRILCHDFSSGAFSDDDIKRLKVKLSEVIGAKVINVGKPSINDEGSIRFKVIHTSATTTAESDYSVNAASEGTLKSCVYTMGKFLHQSKNE